jgi:phage-related protein
MPVIGPQCHELRIQDCGQSWRIAYHVAAEAIVILEVFSKKTQATPLQVIGTCRKRLAAYQRITTGKEQR